MALGGEAAKRNRGPVGDHRRGSAKVDYFSRHKSPPLAVHENEPDNIIVADTPAASLAACENLLWSHILEHLSAEINAAA
jgi:hypothetical protein